MIYYHSSKKMPELEDNSIQCVITSPPYPHVKKWDGLFMEQGCTEYDYNGQLDILKRVWRECHRVLIEGGIMCINIGDATRTISGNFQCYPNAAFTTVECCCLGFIPLIPIYWRKISNRPNAFLGSGFLPVNAYVSQDCEYILIFRKGRLRKFFGEEKTNREKSRFDKEDRDVWYQQIWNIPGAKGAKKTSCWPEEIPYRLMRMFSIIGDTILDPFCGIGWETLYRKYGRFHIGYEITENLKSIIEKGK